MVTANGTDKLLHHFQGHDQNGKSRKLDPESVPGNAALK